MFFPWEINAASVRLMSPLFVNVAEANVKQVATKLRLARIRYEIKTKILINFINSINLFSFLNNVHALHICHS